MSPPRLDGATGFKKVLYITLPLKRSVLVTCTPWPLRRGKGYDLPTVIAVNGAPRLDSLSGKHVSEAFGAQNVDYGSAIP